jgi:hypothetical protein
VESDKNKTDNANPLNEGSKTSSNELLEQRIKHLELSLNEHKEREAWLKNHAENLTDSTKSPTKTNLLGYILVLLCAVFGAVWVVGHFCVAALK